MLENVTYTLYQNLDVDTSFITIYQLEKALYGRQSRLSTDLSEDQDISSVAKRARKDSFADAIEGAAVAFANAVSKPNNSPKCLDSGTPLSSAISPGKTMELRMRNFEQLRYLQSLFEDGVLTNEEFTEQKENILLSLRKLPS